MAAAAVASSRQNIRSAAGSTSVATTRSCPVLPGLVINHNRGHDLCSVQTPQPLAVYVRLKRTWQGRNHFHLVKRYSQNATNASATNITSTSETLHVMVTKFFNTLTSENKSNIMQKVNIEHLRN